MLSHIEHSRFIAHPASATVCKVCAGLWRGQRLPRLLTSHPSPTHFASSVTAQNAADVRGQIHLGQLRNILCLVCQRFWQMECHCFDYATIVSFHVSMGWVELYLYSTHMPFRMDRTNVAMIVASSLALIEWQRLLSTAYKGIRRLQVVTFLSSWKLNKELKCQRSSFAHWSPITCIHNPRTFMHLACPGTSLTIPSPYTSRCVIHNPSRTAVYTSSSVM